MMFRRPASAWGPPMTSMTPNISSRTVGSAPESPATFSARGRSWGSRRCCSARTADRASSRAPCSIVSCEKFHGGWTAEQPQRLPGGVRHRLLAARRAPPGRRRPPRGPPRRRPGPAGRPRRRSRRLALRAAWPASPPPACPPRARSSRPSGARWECGPNAGPPRCRGARPRRCAPGPRRWRARAGRTGRPGTPSAFSGPDAPVMAAWSAGMTVFMSSQRSLAGSPDSVDSTSSGLPRSTSATAASARSFGSSERSCSAAASLPGPFSVVFHRAMLSLVTLSHATGTRPPLASSSSIAHVAGHGDRRMVWASRAGGSARRTKAVRAVTPRTIGAGMLGTRRSERQGTETWTHGNACAGHARCRHGPHRLTSPRFMLSSRARRGCDRRACLSAALVAGASPGRPDARRPCLSRRCPSTIPTWAASVSPDPPPATWRRSTGTPPRWD